MDYWSGVFGNILASLIGTGIAAYLGLVLYKRQLEQDKSNKMDLAIQSLIWELETHKDLMGKHITYVQKGQDIEHHPISYMLSTVSYEAVKSAGARAHHSIHQPCSLLFSLSFQEHAHWTHRPARESSTPRRL